MELLSQDYLFSFGFRWLHILVGIAWIGLLYYFNLVQVPGLAAYGDEGKARNITIDKIARRALWWFRWAAIATLATGILITGQKDYWLDFMNGKDNGHDAAISLGMVLGILMAANVWMIIWKNQKVVLANAANVLAGGEANADAPTAGRKALLASRQNMIFSVSMLFFMVGSAHFYNGGVFASTTTSNPSTFLLIACVIIALLELNAVGIFGGIKAGNKMLWMYESHKNALITSGILWLVLWILSEVMLG
ncbi:MAG: antitermination protein NusG [Actinobacteria bacterium]|nr:antitermination protein NusG [Actinomycetota bacterium]